MKWLLRILIAIPILLAAIYVLSGPDSSIPGKASDQDMLRVAVANLLYTNTASHETARALAGHDIDILVLLEWTGRNLYDMFLTENGYKKSACVPKMGTHGICVFYKSHLDIDAFIERAPVDGPCNMLFATIRVNRDIPIGIQAIHPPPPLKICGDTNKKVMHFHASKVNNGLVSEAIGVLQKGDAAVVLGDFNALASWERVRQYSDAGLQDAFDPMDVGLAPTWSPSYAFPDFARIDYIWVSSLLHVDNAWTLHVPGSDHRAVVADIKL